MHHSAVGGGAPSHTIRVEEQVELRFEDELALCAAQEEAEVKDV